MCKQKQKAKITIFIPHYAKLSNQLSLELGFQKVDQHDAGSKWLLY